MHSQALVLAGPAAASAQARAHASGIHHLFALDFPVPGVMSVAYRCYCCLGLVDQTNGKSPCITTSDHEGLSFPLHFSFDLLHVRELLLY